MKDDNTHKEDIVFHYNREKRIQRGPEAVRKIYAGENLTPQKGLIKIFFTTKGTKLLFTSLMVLIVIIFAISFFRQVSDKTTIAGINIRLSSFLYDNDTFVTLTCTEGHNFSSPLFLDITIQGLNKEKTLVSQKKIEENFAGDEKIYRAIIEEYDIMYVQAIITVSDVSKTIISTVKR